ncbi:RepB family plasmid replication initiator protein, partial [Campylobacter coli]|uniref:replication initiation protein n=1 Tax=Campylobacter coli TaxID=195 RepID=UPI000FBF086B
AFELAEVAELSGKYTETLYRLLKQFRTTGKANIEWEEFCRIMKKPENYRQIDIDKRILKPAIKQLSKERNQFDQIRVP